MGQILGFFLICCLVPATSSAVSCKKVFAYDSAFVPQGSLPGLRWRARLFDPQLVGFDKGWEVGGEPHWPSHYSMLRTLKKKIGAHEEYLNVSGKRVESLYEVMRQFSQKPEVLDSNIGEKALVASTFTNPNVQATYTTRLSPLDRTLVRDSFGKGGFPVEMAELRLKINDHKEQVLLRVKGNEEFVSISLTKLRNTLLRAFHQQVNMGDRIHVTYIHTHPFDVVTFAHPEGLGRASYPYGDFSSGDIVSAYRVFMAIEPFLPKGTQDFSFSILSGSKAENLTRASLILR